MIAGATTHASRPIGTVTEAQMAKILVKEYCLVSAAPSTRAGNDCVFVMSSASRGRRDQHIGRRSGNCGLRYTEWMTRISYRRMTPN